MTEEKEISGKKSEKSTNRNRHGKREKSKPLTKVIIRRLPPSMSEDVFLKQIDPMPDHVSFYFVEADWSLGHDSTSRAYIHFTNPDDIFNFKDRFDGYVFVDNKGAEYPAVVEFAPFQGLPRNKSRKKDPKANSIETDPHFISFLETLQNEENENNKPEAKLEYSYQIKDDKKITSTPLLQYLANKKQERRDERKKKIDEKRKQRDEDKQKKKIQIAKNIPQAIKEEEHKPADKDKPSDKDKKGKKEKGDESNNNMSRSSRRAERDRKRREERNRERERKQQTDKPSETASDKVEVKEIDKGKDKSKEKDLDKEKEKDIEKEKDKDDGTKKKETKKYSESRREKRRLRAEARKLDLADSNVSIQSNISNSADASESMKEGSVESSILSLIEDNVEQEKTKTTNVNDTVGDLKMNTDVSDSVKDFIRSVAHVKEFVPRNRDLLNIGAAISANALQTAEILKSNEEKKIKSTPEEKTTQNLSDARDKLEQIKLSDFMAGSKEDTIKPYDAEEKDAERSPAEPNDTERDDKSARRIRNKDRPSLEIYQPGKLRMNNRKEDGRSSTELKDYKSNPTSDCESVKADKQVTKKKVARYSERRSNRAKDICFTRAESKEDVTAKDSTASNIDSEINISPVEKIMSIPKVEDIEADFFKLKCSEEKILPNVDDN